MSTINSQLDLNKVKDIIFQDIFKLLDSFNLQYTKDGDNIFMKCPIHEGSDNPNGLSISLDKQIWRCWTRSCHEDYKTDIFGFIKGLLHTDSFSEVLKHISKLYDLNGARKSGAITPVYDNVNCDSIDNNKDIFNTIVTTVRRNKAYTIGNNKTLQHAELKTGSTPSAYFISRGYREETLRFFGIQDSTEKDGPLKYRAIIPINFNNNYVGYIARATKEWLQPKYIFSEGIRKTDYLYNYDNAIESANQINCMWLVEGQGDVWRLWECGVKNVVGLFGKDISDEQRKLLLSSGVTTLVILTDNDPAGRESKIKIKRDLGRLFKLIFPKMYTKDLGDMFVENVKTNILKDLQRYY